ncbi:unnamed protein product [Acanthoscelides obtectus]|nr:unnamed protein product [Acanthoscelides obtectus]CAK1630637.1 hypothetical protein AOBTE_LOCUS6465 [Acanthoscelides obtectus]
MKYLPGELTEHLNKFSNRSLNFNPSTLSQQNIKEVLIEKKTLASNEFSDIITSYEALKQKNKKIEESINVDMDQLNIKPDPDNPDSGIIGKVTNKNSLVTFKELQRNIEHKANRGKKVDEDEKLILKSLETHSSAQEIVTQVLRPEDVVAISKNKYKSSGGSLVKKSERDYSHLIYPERIVIPKDKVKKHCIYKLNDCYYDHDGYFLYRVPGME